MDWALRSCSRRGHETYAPDEENLRARLHVLTAVGPAWRCLRCGVFVPGPARRSGPADAAPEIPHGRLLRDRFVLRLLALDRFVRAAVLGLVGCAVLRFRGEKGRVQAVFDEELPLLQPLADQIGWNIDDSKLVRAIDRAFTLSDTTLTWIAVAVFGYAVLMIVEGTGLWLAKRWGEYFAVIATAVFLPLEIYEIAERVTVLRVGALVINLAAIAWLVWSKRLFGVRGGAAAQRAEHDAESVLTVERAAAS